MLLLRRVTFRDAGAPGSGLTSYSARPAGWATHGATDDARLPTDPSVAQLYAIPNGLGSDSQNRLKDIPDRWLTRARRRSTVGSVVPMSRILVTGMSGTGKSSALAELGRRGYRVVDTDDPGWREYRAYVESSDELHRGEWLWIEEKISGLLDSDDGRPLFVQGCVRNQSKFYDRFNAIVLLSAPADVILDRIASRTTNSYGKTPVELAMILDDLARVEPLLRESCTHELDASRPLDEVVGDLIAIASRPMTTS